MLKSRLDKPYSCFDGSCNPEHPTHWLKEFLDNAELDIYLQKYTIFDNPFLPEAFVEQLCKEYEGTIYYDRLILGLWKRADGAIYKRFADNPDAFRCEVVDEFSPDPEYQQFRKEDITSIEIGLDFGGNQSGHSFVARGYTDDYRNVIALKSRRIMAKDENEDIDSNMLDKMFCDFVGEVIEEYAVISKRGEYVQYCNVETVYSGMPWKRSIRGYRSASQGKRRSMTGFGAPSSSWEQGGFLLQGIASLCRLHFQMLCGIKMSSERMNDWMMAAQILTVSMHLNTRLNVI